MNSNILNELNVGMLIRIKENSWNGKDYINLENYLTDDINTINYRLDALTDLLENKELYDTMIEIVPQLDGFREMRSISSTASDEVDDLYSVRELQIYVNLVDYLHEKLKKLDLKSELFLKVRNEINTICDSDEYNDIKKRLPENVELISTLKSITLGINLDLSLKPIEAGIVSINDQRYVSGNIIDKLLRGDMQTNSFQCCAPITATGKLLSNDEKQKFEGAINSGLHRILKNSLRSWKPAVKAYSQSKVNFLLGYYGDLRFLISAAEFYYRLKEKRYPVCRPVVFSKEEKKCVLKGTYYPEFIMYTGHMSLNDIEFDENGMLYIFTGANGGGKSMFAKSVAMCQTLFQLGLYVPAEYAELSPCSEILLHFTQRDTDIAKSRFMDECERMSKMMRAADSFSMVLCDEALSGTSANEAVAIASEVIKAMCFKGCRGIFITHLHELTMLPDEINAFDGCISRLDNLTVSVDEETGKRLYKVQRTCPDKTSRASDIAKQYGLDFESLINTN